MTRENQPAVNVVTDEPVEIEKQPVEGSSKTAGKSPIVSEEFIEYTTPI